MTNKDDAPEWAKREIGEAIRILREDGIHIHKTYAKFLKANTEPPKDDDNPPAPKDGDPPPPKEEPGEDSTKRPGLWWGARAHDE